MPKKEPLPVGRDFEERVLRCFERKFRYVLSGEVSLETGYSLNTVLYHLDELEIRGAIRRLTYPEKKGFGLHDLADALVLVDSGRFTLDR